MEEAQVEPGALMICSVIVRWLEGGRREMRCYGAESSIGFCCHQPVLSDHAEHTVTLWAPGCLSMAGDAMPP